MDKLDIIWEWLKLQSTQKGLIVLAGLVGIQVTPEFSSQIAVIAAMAYSFLALFKDKS